MRRNLTTSDDNLGFPKSTAQIAGHPIHPMLVGFPIAFFLSALASDVAHVATGEERWAHTSAWLLGAGLVSSVGAAAAGMADYLGDSRVRRSKVATIHMVGNVAAVALETANFLIRKGGDAPDAVRPAGLSLSAISAGILGVTAALGGSLVYKQRVGVSPPGAFPV